MEVILYILSLELVHVYISKGYLHGHLFGFKLKQLKLGLSGYGFNVLLLTLL